MFNKNENDDIKKQKNKKTKQKINRIHMKDPLQSKYRNIKLFLSTDNNNNVFVR